MTEPQPLPETSLATRLLHWVTRRPYWSLTLLTLAVLGPFITKPFNIDDPLFVQAAKQICQHPANPYGFEVNWYGTPAPMWEITKNPPLACYYLALAGSWFGWTEWALHSALLLPAIAVVLGTYRLARHFCPWPATAAGLTLFTPVILISSSTLMCDILMLAFWLWATVLWIEGLAGDHCWRLAVAGVLVALAALTKYFGACLIPLLLAYTLIRQWRQASRTLWLAIPVASLMAYQAITFHAYGKGLLSDAGAYSQSIRQSIGTPQLTSCFIAITFTGGCLASITFLTPWIWPRRLFLGMISIVALAGVAILKLGGGLSWYEEFADSSRGLVIAQMIFWACGGTTVLGLMVADYRRHRDAPSALLGLWVLGTFAFTAFCNWTVNGRSILPLTPAAMILLLRHRQFSTPTRLPSAGLGLALGLGMFTACLALWGDYRLAVTVRHNAEQTFARFGHEKQSLWFDGHWGFQYYMEALGAQAVNWHDPRVQAGDFLAIPINNCYAHFPDPDHIPIHSVLSDRGPAFFSTMERHSGGGFYSALIGPLPVAFGRVRPEATAVFVMPAPVTELLKTPGLIKFP